jgi:aminobenzoyl-glutamate utilization protein B
MDKSRLYETVDEKRATLEDVALEIWENPELGLHEEKSSRLLRETLEAEGFEIEQGIGGMPTAFLATYGEGEPRIGILGEFDALPSLSQKAQPEREPVEEGAPGHGCGHNLFGTACLGGAVAVKRAIEAGDLDGTVVYAGCPAEETLVGKVFMARAGAFDDLDAAITWHPSDLNTAQTDSSLALDSVRYSFEGEAAHAAASPESGRSALDAVQLMNTATEYMREHVSEEARIHYNIVEGGQAPNVVPPEATVWYFVRAPTRDEVERITAWLDDIAEGAAMMTQTEGEKRMLTGCYDYLPNDVVTEIVWENLQEVGAIDYDDGDREFAAKLQETFPEERIEERLENVDEDHRDAAREDPLYTEPVPPSEDSGGSGSTDVGDVSWITPMGQFRATTWALGTPAHSWQAVAADGSFGTKGMLHAAKVVAGTVADLMEDEERLAAARDEFENVAGEDAYESPLPEDAEPPFDTTS